MLKLETVLQAYAYGIFPMAESKEDEGLFWVDPEHRGIIPLGRFHVSRSLARTIRQGRFRVTVDTHFRAVVEGCAEARPGRENSWINGPILDLYTRLHTGGFAHSVEVWQGERMVGGLYGVSLGGAFFGESMFSRMTDASKVALVHTVARLKAGGYCLMDTQFLTAHLQRFGAVEIPRSDYHRRLRDALPRTADFYSLAADAAPELVLQLSTQTS
jgi:leucyl/phenylalanyl-tRNA--protein transferase